jgi:integrase
MPDQSSPTTLKRKTPEGIEIRHSRTCPSLDGGRCRCEPSYRAWVYDRQAKAKVKKTHATLAEAKAWRAATTTKRDRGRRITPTRTTFREAALAWLEGAETGSVLNSSDQPYKPSVLRAYRHDIMTTLIPEFGSHALGDIRRGDWQRLVDRLNGEGKSGSKIANIICPARVIYRHTLQRTDDLEVNPTIGLKIPKGGKPRQRAASATEVATLIGALPLEDRALWATAAYAGCRRGELRGLQWQDVDLAGGIIRITRAWDDMEGFIAPKSAAGIRTVPIVAVLREHLEELKARTGRGEGDFVFGAKAGSPFATSHIRKRAAEAWKVANVERAKQELPPLVPIMLHECRHTFVSLMFDAGLSLEQIGGLVGHSAASMTEAYAHLIEGHEAKAGALFDAYLAGADTAARLAQIEAAA